MKRSKRELGLPHWSKKQRQRIQELVKAGVTIAYWNSDQHGRPANGGKHDDRAVKPGLVQEIPGPLVLCGPGALHATLKPHRWAGCRVWVVALHGEVKQQEDKLGSLKREFLGEILPEEAFCPSVGVRLGRKDLQNADLQYANLRSANLQSANLQNANLRSANLQNADLQYANLRSANLQGADLQSANLQSADLQSANLQSADLQSANLRNANLRSANLQSANLQNANLQYARSHIEYPGYKLENGILLKK